MFCNPFWVPQIICGMLQVKSYFGHVHNSYDLHIKDAKYNEGTGKVKVKFQNIFDIDRPQAF